MIAPLAAPKFAETKSPSIMRPFLTRVLWMVAIALGIGFPGRAYGQEKLSLVLSGGSQRAWSFIPLLQWLEEKHVPVSKISGASGGALVAAIYHEGYSPKQIQQILRYVSAGMKLNRWVVTGLESSPGKPSSLSQNEAWGKLLGTDVPYDVLGLLDKADRRQSQLGIRYGTKTSGLSGISSGPEIGVFLSRLSLGHIRGNRFANGNGANQYDFNCVSTNLGTNPPQEVVHDSGSMASALRATMAIPEVFAPIPVTADDVARSSMNTATSSRVSGLLSDGGILDVFPAIATSGIGAKDGSGRTEPIVVLGASVQPDVLQADTPATSYNPSQDATLFGTAGKILTASSTDQIKRNAEFALAHGYFLQISRASGTWIDQELYFKAGMEAINACADALASKIVSKCSVSDQAWQDYLKQRQAIKRDRQFKVSHLDVRIITSDGRVVFVTDSSSARYLKQRLSVFADPTGKVLWDATSSINPSQNIIALEEKIETICGEGRYMYGLYEREPQQGLLVTFYEEGIGPAQVRFGAQAQLETTHDTKATLISEFKDFDVVKSGDVLRSGIGVGNSMQAFLLDDLPAPFFNDHDSRIRLRLRASAIESDNDLWSTSGALNRVNTASTGTATLFEDVVFSASHSLEFFGGVGFDNRQSSSIIGTSPVPTGSVSAFASEAGILLDQTDHATMPLRGVALDLGVTHYSGDASTTPSIGKHYNLNVESGSALVMFPFKNQDSSLFLRGGFGHADQDISAYGFYLGGLHQIGSDADFSLFGSSYYYGSIGERHPLSYGDGFVLKRTDLLAYYEVGRVLGYNSDIPTQQSLDLGIQSESILGTFELTVSTWFPLQQTRLRLVFGGRF